MKDTLFFKCEAVGRFCTTRLAAGFVISYRASSTNVVEAIKLIFEKIFKQPFNDLEANQPPPSLPLKKERRIATANHTPTRHQRLKSEELPSLDLMG
jgi:hypothetical protein